MLTSLIALSEHAISHGELSRSQRWNEPRQWACGAAMTQVACVDLPALPLQLVLRQHPHWRAHPVVVVEEDRPQGVVLWASEHARAQRVLPGQRFAEALSLCSELRAQVVSAAQLTTAVEELLTALTALSPRVEPARETLAAARGGAAGAGGTFWLDGAGLQRLYRDGASWGAAILQAVRRLGFAAVTVVGFARFATYALARATTPARSPAPLVFASEEQERAAAAAVALARLEIDPKLRDALGRLGVATLGQMVRLPGGGILERFGVEAHRLYQLAAGERWDPLVPVAPPQCLEERVLLDDEEHSTEGLVFVIKGAVDRLLAQLAARRRALTALHLELRLRHAVHDLETRTDCIKPAEPTLDSRALLRLVHLRLEAQPPAAGVVELRLWAQDVAASREQLAMFVDKPPRDPRAAEEVLSLLRAELGEDAVVRPVLRDGHLPEARFGWERIDKLRRAAPQPRLVRALVRRVFSRPRALPPQATSVRNDGWMLSGLAHGSVVRIVGPYVISGGWWANEVHREYHFAETKRGDCLWVYYDRGRRRWFWHGAVE
jgi:protein ImuB